MGLATVFRQIRRSWVSVGVAIVVFAAGVLSCALFQKCYSARKVLHTIDLRDRRFSERIEVSISSVRSKKLMVALVIGQSNSANFGESPRKAREHVYNFYGGRLYTAQDPLLGADGDAGSVWTRLGDKLIEAERYEAVVIVPLGVGRTEIGRWKSDGDLHPRIVNAIRDLNSRGLTITHLFWHQGETDALLGTSKGAYKSMFLDMLSSIRKQGVRAPIYVSVATRCQKQRETPEIRQAQQELVDKSLGIYAGPDTDTLDFYYRYDGCHFSDEGLDRFAELWLEKLRPNWQER